MKKSQSFFPSLLFAALLVLCACFAHAQVYPFMALGNAQFFDNNGKPLTAGVLYSYQAGTSTQQATYTDSTSSALNPNPIPFGSGARVSIWLSAANKYKFVLCLQNDGPACAPADVLFSVDQVPACPGCSAGGNTFTGTFISGSPNPATTGILELASTDAVCWRNQAGTANLCITKDTSDVLSWTGNTIKFAETGCSATALNFDYLCANIATHHLSIANNNLVYGSVPVVTTAATSGHLAGYAANGIDLQDSGATAPVTTAVTFSATPTFTATSQDQLFTMTLTANVTSSTLTMTSLPTPSLVSFELTQDATGGRTFVWPTNVIGPLGINSAPNAITTLEFLWDGTNARLIGPGCGVQSKTAAYTLQATDCIVQASVSGGAFTITIPHLLTGTVWRITRTDTTGANALTIAGDSGNVNGAASFRLGVNATTVCHADGTNSWCSIPGTEYMQSTTLTASATTFTYPVPYSAAPNCFCTGVGGSCNVASVSTTACVLNVTVANNAVMVSGKP